MILVTGAVRLVLERGRAGETYNIGGGCEKQNIDVLRTICALLDEARPRKGEKHAEFISFVRDRAGHDWRYAMDASATATTTPSTARRVRGTRKTTHPTSSATTRA